MRSPAKRQQLIAEINITPFTDVILVLLIIFMITTPLILQSNIQVNLPSSATGKPPKDTARQISVMVTNEGMTYLDNRPVSRKALKAEVDKLHQADPNLEVILYSDRMVRFKDIVSLLDIFNELNIKNLNIATKTE
ncbi:MAG TPA: biopolymer transporter ExbD [Candidatus Omnitrophota bacterium]|jgi:biopolymer transport protein ExbD|nr:biopolymer transporter ExbD [Candidatus Omnitrophota bacterium]HPT38975.1 biopolymer transporter ExbD [Candidatus Omnitrophota bacterium]